MKSCGSFRVRTEWVWTWLFADIVAGANSSAELFSLIETCKANAMESYTYLRRVFTAQPKSR